MLNVTIANHAGFCFGVKRAIQIVSEQVKKTNPIYTLGPLIHNPPEVNRLESLGIYNINNQDVAGSCPIVIRTHGIKKEVKENLINSDNLIIDATCPHVKYLIDVVSLAKKEEYTTVIMGDKNHPEVDAASSYANYNTIIINSPKQLLQIKKNCKLVLCAQTTQHNKEFSELVKEAVLRFKEIRVFNTICKATEERQNSVLKLAKNSNIVIIVGGKNSANTKRLVELSLSIQTRTYLIESCEELKKEWFKDNENIGITAGASTPEWMINRVVDSLTRISYEIDTPKEIL